MAHISNHMNRGRIDGIKSRNGFSLLEMVIAIGVFASVLAISVQIVLSASDAQVRSSLQRAVQDNIRYSIEYMNKELRTARGITTLHDDGSSCGPQAFCERIRFTNDRAQQIMYCILNSVLIRSKPLGGAGGDCDPLDPESINIHLTSNDVTINSLFFYVAGNAAGSSDGQPIMTATINVTGTTGKARTAVNMHLQTTVVQRLRDF